MNELEYERRLKRHHVSGVVEVYNSNTEQHLGRLVNIHHEGLMVMGTGGFSADHVYQLELVLPEPIEGIAHLHVGVDCLWSKVVDVSGTYWSGCQVIDLSDVARRQIDHLIEQLGTTDD